MKRKIYEKVRNYYLRDRSFRNSSSYGPDADAEILATYGVETDKISDVAIVFVDVTVNGGEKIADCEVTLVEIGMSWYMDNLSTDISRLFSFCK